MTRNPTHSLKPVVQKPVCDSYGLPAGFDFSKYELEEKKFLIFRNHAEKAVHFLIWLALMIAICSTISLITRWNPILFLWPFIAICIPMSNAIHERANVRARIKPKPSGCLAYWDKMSTYKADLAAWEFTNSERGVGYWHALRGIDLEHAAASLFRRRGCEVTITKGSGDGGVDLVLNIAGKAYWCQCKGHGKPVQPAPIREIAGVCNRGQAAPVLLAVNGYTNSAREEATALGVVCLDAPDLCRLASLEWIASIYGNAPGS